ncbi:MAG TPA: ABC transporter ATP-binding protein [Steroidobacter sp.]|nr:ABC transporter ATP-binding protein [Steroidobacter sp.]
MANSAIEIRGAVKRYGAIEAVGGVDLRIERGEVFGLIGHNGAGKSTLFKMMLGLIPATAGDIRIDGTSINGKAFREVRRGVGYLPENVVLYENLNGLETLDFFASLKGLRNLDGRAMLERVGLAEAGDRRVKTYSKGMRQRLGFAQALLGEPRLMFLDEPTNGLDPEGIREFYGLLREQRDRGATIVLTSHILSEIQERVDRLAIMKTGRIQALGAVSSLREQMRLPLLFELRLAPGAEDAVRAALTGVDASAFSLRGERATVQCPRESKMRMVAAICGLGAHILDVQIREPSLEDVFLGYSG